MGKPVVVTRSHLLPVLCRRNDSKLQHKSASTAFRILDFKSFFGLTVNSNINWQAFEDPMIPLAEPLAH